MTRLAYYNEHEPYAAAWLRNLIAAGHIAPGDVDERSIVDVRPADLAGYTQCHFFAGIGVWSYALRLAGWPDDRPVWTGSCPCQPLSSAGLRLGHADERHLWPALHGLIAERRPAAFLGEQVASQDGREWFAAVRADLEHLGYACGAADLAAAGVGAPHIRQRLFFVADASRAGGGRDAGTVPGPKGEGGRAGSEPRDLADEPLADGAARVVADAAGAGPQGRGSRGRARPGYKGAAAERGGAAGRLVDAEGAGCSRTAGGGGQGRRSGFEHAGALGDANATGRSGRTERDERAEAGQHAPSGADAERPGFWSAVDWLPCRDGKARPVEPGTFPLAHGASARVGRLRAYGNAVVAPLAAEFVGAYLDARAE